MRRLLLVSPLAVLGCDSVAVTPLEVGRLEITPRSLELAVGGSARLTASATDASGSPLPTGSITWRSSDPSIVEVDSDGQVTGLSVGVAAITASAAGVVASAAISVRAPGFLVLSDSSLVFRGERGGADPPTQTVRITDTQGTSSGLSAQVVHDAGQPFGWLTASLSSTDAPTDLTVRVRTAGLPIGRFGADVRVGSVTAPNALVLRVELEVTDPQPAVSLALDSLRLVDTASERIAVSNGGGGTLTGLQAAVRYLSGGSGWLRATLSGTTAPTTLTVESLPIGLAAGEYDAMVDVTSSVAGTRAASLAVHLTVGTVAPYLQVIPNSVALSGPANTGSPSATVQLRNGGGGVITGLSKAVSYAPGQPSGWLTATLAGSSTPTTVALLGSTLGLPPGTYSASVELAGDSVASIFLPVTLTVVPATPTAPAAPSGLSATANGSTAVTMSWTDNSNNETGFEIERSVSGGTFSALASAAVDVTTYDDATVQPATDYEYRVRACNSVGCSAWSAVASVTTPGQVPAAPSALSATATGPNAVSLAWTDNSSTESGFEIERAPGGGAFAPLASVATDVTTYDDPTVQGSSPYEYRVRACNSLGCSAWSNVASVSTPGQIPAAPSGLQATVPSSTLVTLSWTDNSANEGRFEIERASGSGSFTALASVAANVTTYDDATVQATTTYEYRVRACNPSGCSGWSNVVSVTTPGVVPSVPATLTAVALSAIDVDLSWSDVTQETEYEVEQGSGGSGGFQPIAKTPANVTTLRVTNLAPGGTYRFRVRACNAAGCSGWTSTTTIKTPVPTQVPSDPSNIQFVSVSRTQIVLAWKDNSSDETRFEIEEGDLFSPWLKIGEVGVNVTTFTDTSVRRGFPIYYRVRACNPVGCSSPSAPIVTIVP